MDHVLNLHIVILLVVFVLLLSAPCFEGLVHVVGPSQPILATVGDEVILPCQLEPAKKASGMTVEWARSDLNPRFVYVWRDGVELESKTHPSYKRRTKVFPDEQKIGDVSLNLSKVKLSDGGTYKCFIPGHGDALIQLVVADFFTVPPSSSVRFNIGVIALVIFFLCRLAVAFAWWKWKTSRKTL
ncbi:myelin-oligodendrocyte glycoprotein-like isoform X2 [Perca fluviatilis]|uniref:myelin-oligodendrocyte glycoprotein-like isoform X2 n=1 Tax=Perca fluviatilis TaxID=8168 RepID=UPI001964610A|nr:myelin-oligodendrocyte glycoprotein-like isoform X2 [Perca fluviatilis]